jgi:hypothetical protein
MPCPPTTTLPATPHSNPNLHLRKSQGASDGGCTTRARAWPAHDERTSVAARARAKEPSTLSASGPPRRPRVGRDSPASCERRNGAVSCGGGCERPVLERVSGGCERPAPERASGGCERPAPERASGGCERPALEWTSSGCERRS